MMGVNGDKMSKNDSIPIVVFLKINLNGGETLCNLRN